MRRRNQSRSQAKPLPTPSPPPLCKLRRRIFHVVRGGRAGWSAKWCHSIMDHRSERKFNTKIDNSILLLCYFDKICLIHTGNFWRALASLYSEAIKGSQSLQLALSRLHHILQATSLWTKEVGHSNTRGTVRLCSFPLKITAAHSLHFQHLMWTRGYYFKTSTVKRSLVSIVHINS